MSKASKAGTVVKKLHFVGIGGSGISGVANLASVMGYTVSGCDRDDLSAYFQKPKSGQNKDESMVFFKGQDPEHVRGAELVITSPALFYSGDIPEIEEAKKAGKLITWQKFVGDFLCRGKKVICIAGTHGKSTTTAMVGKILTDAGLDPTVVIGASVPEWGGNWRFGKGEYVVIEADEFNDNFLNYAPDMIVLNNIEFDHPDYFKNLDSVKKSFDKFIARLKKDGILFVQKDSLNLNFNLQVFGEHNQKNANMAFLVGKSLGIGENAIKKSLETFSGIGRRMEKISERGGIKVFDDYAHHPSAIQTTIAGLRKFYPTNRIITVVEPHGYARTKALLNGYGGVFSDADMVFIGPIYAARDAADDSITPEHICKASGHGNCQAFFSFDNILENIGRILEPGDIVLVMGAGKSYLWAREIVNILPMSFKDLTTFKVGGRIKKFFEVKTRKETDNAILFARENKLPILVVGGGSDLLVNDSDFDGVVIKYTKSGIGYEHSSKGTFVMGFAGTEWDKLVEYCVNNNLGGVECLSGIPGSVGAAPIQNIGAYGQELKDTFYKLIAYDLVNRKFKTFYSKDCAFSYRESIFKTPEFWQKYLITKVFFKVNENGKPKIKYESLKTYLNEKGINKPTLKEIRDAVLVIRNGKFEDPKIIGNAGSFFKNPVIDKQNAVALLKNHPDAKYFETNTGYKVFAGWLIEKAGWKGKSYKSAAVSPRHALILINPDGKAYAKDILELSEKIIIDIKAKFDITLQREVQLINF